LDPRHDDPIFLRRPKRASLVSAQLTSIRVGEASPVHPCNSVPPDRYEITFNDVPIGTRVSFRVNDQNACDENATGAVARNVFANDVLLVQNTTTPGNGDEPGYALTVAANGTISQ